MADTPIARMVKERIAREGPIPFHDVMQMALYDPEWGYYSRGPEIGPGGDFSTSVSFPAFREAMARLVRQAWIALGRPAAFRVVELGAGTGQLAAHILSSCRDVPLEYVTVDASPALRARQAAVPGVKSAAKTEELAPSVGIVLGNEVLDALPVRRVFGTDDVPLEVHLGLDAEGRFRERLLPLKDASVLERLAKEGVSPQRGQICDVAPGLEDLVARSARLVERGFLVLIDYGDAAPALYAPSRINGSLAAYRAGGRFVDPYDRLGEQDLTADVDFTAVARAAVSAGMEEMGLASQQEVLEALGIAELGLPDEIRQVAGAAGLGTAFWVAAFRKGTRRTLPGFGDHGE